MKKIKDQKNLKWESLVMEPEPEPEPKEPSNSYYNRFG